MTTFCIAFYESYLSTVWIILSWGIFPRMYRNANRSTGAKVQTYKCHCTGTTYGLRIHTHYLYHALKQGIENRNTVANASKSFEVEPAFFLITILNGSSRWLLKKRRWKGEGKNPRHFQSYCVAKSETTTERLYSIRCKLTDLSCLYSIMG